MGFLKDFFGALDDFGESIERGVRKTVGWENLLMAAPQLFTGNIPGALATLGGGVAGTQAGIDYGGLLPFLMTSGLPALNVTLANVADKIGLGGLYESGIEKVAGLGGLLGLGATGAGAGAGAGTSGGIGTGGGLLGGLGGLLRGGGGGGGIGGGIAPLLLGLYGASALSKPEETSYGSTTTPLRPPYTENEQALRDYLIQMGKSQPQMSALQRQITGAY